ncbi:MAG: general secretion pathway protein GspB [Candidatus Omnitrophica bacterium]|nr:general secretion pathway protein GspB [Candidatus Omnitrophota bacterium]
MRKAILVLLLFLLCFISIGLSEEDFLLDDFIYQDFIYEEENLADPFEPVVKEEREEELPQQIPFESQEEKPLPYLDIQGVVWGTGLPQVIINNTVLRVGDTIEGVKILKINKEGIEVEFNRKIYKLAIPASSYPLKTEEKE